MPTCYKHGQMYSMDEYCIYCGNPMVIKTSATYPNEQKTLYTRSDCCNAPVNTAEGEEGTNYFACSRCDKPCDAH